MAITEFTVSSSNTNKWASVSTSAVGGSTKYGIYVTNASNPTYKFQNSNFYPTTTSGSIALVELYANSEGRGNGDPNTAILNFTDGVYLTNSKDVYGDNSNTKYHYYVYNFANNGYSDTKIMAIGGNKNRRVFAIRSWGKLDVNYNKPYIEFGGNTRTLHYNGASAGYSVGCAGATRGTSANAWVTHTAGDGTKYYAITNDTNNCNAYAAIALTAGHTYRFTLHAHTEAGYDGVAICKTTNGTEFDSLTASDLLSGSTSTGKCSGNNVTTTFNYVEMGAEQGTAVTRYIYFKTNGLGIGVNTTISDSHGNIISSSYNGKSFADVMVEDLGDLRSTQTAPTAANVTVEYGQTAKASASGGGGQGALQYRDIADFIYGQWTTTAPTRTEVGVTQYQARWSGNTSYKASPVSNTAKLTVVPKQITKPTANENLLYNGSGQLGVHNIPEGTYAAGNGTVSATNAGSYSVTYTLTNTTNYCWADGTTNPVTVNWSIAPREATLKWGTTSWTYDGNSHSTTCTVSNLIGSDSCTVTLSGNSIKNAGSATVTATALSNSNYVLSTNTSIKTTKLTVYAKEATLKWGTRSWTYDGNTHSTTCTVSNLVGSDSCTVTLNNNSIKNVGSTTVTAASLNNGNYTLPSGKTATLTVNPRTVTLSWGTRSWTYDGNSHSTTCTAGNLVGSDSCTVTLSGNSIKNVGSTTVTAASLNNGNYTLPSGKTATLTVNPRTVTLNWGTRSWVYNGSAHSTTCTAGNLISGDSCTVTLSGNSITNVGSTTVTAASLNNGNYTLPSSKTATLTVTAKEATLKWGTLTWLYDGTAHSTTCTVSNLIGSDSCTVTLSGNSITNVGTTTVTATALSNGNYKLPSSKTATLRINPCMYFKKAGSWVPVKEIYKKVNGSWVKQTTAANIKNVFSTSGKYLGRYLDGSTWKNLIG